MFGSVRPTSISGVLPLRNYKEEEPSLALQSGMSLSLSLCRSHPLRTKPSANRKRKGPCPGCGGTTSMMMGPRDQSDDLLHPRPPWGGSSHSLSWHDVGGGVWDMRTTEASATAARQRRERERERQERASFSLLTHAASLRLVLRCVEPPAGRPAPDLGGIAVPAVPCAQSL